MLNNTSFRAATVLALVTAVISGTNNFLTKIAVSAMKDPIAYTTLKNTIVALLLFAVFVLLRKWPEIRGLRKGQIGALLLIGIVGGAAAFALYFTGLAGTSAINAALIHKTLFLWVAMLALPLLGERMTTLQWVGIATIFGGNLLIGGFAGFLGNTAELMVIGATLLWAVENIIAKKALKELSSITVAAARMGIGAIFLLGFLSITGRSIPFMAISSAAWGWTLLTSFLLFGYVLGWYTALKYAPATYVATLLVSATIVTNILSAVFVTGVLTGKQIGSMALLFVGVSLVVFSAREYTASLKSVTPVSHKEAPH